MVLNKQHWEMSQKGGKGNYGIAASAVDYSDELYTYLRILDIKDDGTIDFGSLKSVNDEKAANYILQPNDIVFAKNRCKYRSQLLL